MQVGRVSGKIAVVTGGAQGLGAGIATVLAPEQAIVIITDLNQPTGKTTARQLGIHFRRHDVTSELEWRELLAAIESEFGGLDILVNNAGISGSGRTQDPEHATLDDWQRIHRVNGDGVFLGCKHAIPVMRRRGGGSIVNLSSIAAMRPTPLIASYGASKASVLQLTRSVARYCAETKSGVRCNAVLPGQIRTPMHDAMITATAVRAGANAAAVRDEFLKKIPMGKFGTPEDVGHAVLYLASDEARYVTGISLVVDGGMDS